MRGSKASSSSLSGDDGLKSLVKVMRVLDAFTTSDRALSVGEICLRTGFPRSTAHRLLASMRDTGLLAQDGERDRYRLGLRLFELGNIALANMDLHREARPYVDSLVRLSGHPVHLAVFDGRQAVVIQRAGAGQDGVPAAFIENSPAYCTSVGKAILAFQPDAVVDRLIAAGLTRYTENTITDPARLRAHLSTVRGAGYAIDEAEHHPGLRCVGAPIRDPSGRAFASISVSAAAVRFPASTIGAMATLVCHSAQAISLALGWRTGLPG